MIQLDFSKHSVEELRDLNSRIVDYLNAARRARQVKAAAEFDIGDHVQFKSKKTGEVIKGEVFRVNRITIRIACDDGRTWKVSPSLLQKSPRNQMRQALR